MPQNIGMQTQSLFCRLYSEMRSLFPPHFKGYRNSIGNPVGTRKKNWHRGMLNLAQTTKEALAAPLIVRVKTIPCK